MDFKHAEAEALSASHTQLGSDCVRGREREERGTWFEWWKEKGARERVREVNLSHQFETDLFFPAKVTSC